MGRQDYPRQQRPDISKAQELLETLGLWTRNWPQTPGIPFDSEHLATLGRLLVSRAGSYSDRIGARN